MLLTTVYAIIPGKKVTPPAPLLPIPTEKQMAWHEMELNAFIHFTTNTFTGLEWGFGNESPAIFNPSQADPLQWVKVLKQAGFKQVILTCKHHDGFCLWPSQYTEHSVKNSPWKNGKGDVVKEVAEACQKQGVKFGVYLSPWDRNRADYGKPAYITYYRNQLQELFTHYGPVSEMWFDGANGGNGYYGGANDTRKINGATYYDWPNTLSLVRSYQPEVLFFSDAGPDLRWVGNETGVAGTTNWNTISNDTLYAGKGNIEQLLNTGSEDGSKWIPAEVDVSIRPGWFYHPEQDSLVKSAEKLFQIYLSSVGRGSTLLLNVPPDKRGLIHEHDITSLQGFRKLLDIAFKSDLAKNARIQVSSWRSKLAEYAASNLNDGKKETYWTTDDNITTGTIEIDLLKKQTVKYIVLQEYIRLGQRVKSFAVEILQNNEWKQVAASTTIGYKRILPVTPVETQKLRITISDAKACPVISNIELY
jgi:alpha-L-fucosidase